MKTNADTQIIGSMSGYQSTMPGLPQIYNEPAVYSAPGTADHVKRILSSESNNILSEINPAESQEYKDPINALKSIFNQQKKVKRAPVDINPIMTKYLSRDKGKNRTIRSVNALQNYSASNGTRGKIYKEDFMPMSSAMT